VIQAKEKGDRDAQDFDFGGLCFFVGEFSVTLKL
jgi:hypothetical protein